VPKTSHPWRPLGSTEPLHSGKQRKKWETPWQTQPLRRHWQYNKPPMPNKDESELWPIKRIEGRDPSNLSQHTEERLWIMDYGVLSIDGYDLVCSQTLETRGNSRLVCFKRKEIKVIIYPESLSTLLSVKGTIPNDWFRK